MAGDLIVYQGTRLDAVFAVTDAVGAALTLTANGYTAAAMQIRKYTSSTDVLLDLSTSHGLTIEPGGATGEIHVHAGADETVGLFEGAVYDCLAWNPSDHTDVLLIASGKVTVQLRVTQKP